MGDQNKTGNTTTDPMAQGTGVMPTATTGDTTSTPATDPAVPATTVVETPAPTTEPTAPVTGEMPAAPTGEGTGTSDPNGGTTPPPTTGGTTA